MSWPQFTFSKKCDLSEDTEITKMCHGLPGKSNVLGILSVWLVTGYQSSISRYHMCGGRLVTRHDTRHDTQHDRHNLGLAPVSVKAPTMIDGETWNFGSLGRAPQEMETFSLSNKWSRVTQERHFIPELTLNMGNKRGLIWQKMQQPIIFSLFQGL